ncbi:uncharacterized protein AB675_5632 [Cyphellophora attinorum]|uniref:Uncharacterized protein n=1 Tax=Cyphellophora attinorum TaxID=1664694 RepID=A0A0N0NNU9_9EURO|nr:uncharacterized protein AB675_5632 [Phialophora attinorum]KPI41799.1 hypothetical protein AB675_5632 [Phialophora attinorum]
MESSHLNAETLSQALKAQRLSEQSTQKTNTTTEDPTSSTPKSEFELEEDKEHRVKAIKEVRRQFTKEECDIVRRFGEELAAKRAAEAEAKARKARDAEQALLAEFKRKKAQCQEAPGKKVVEWEDDDLDDLFDSDGLDWEV